MRTRCLPLLLSLAACLSTVPEQPTSSSGGSSGGAASGSISGSASGGASSSGASGASSGTSSSSGAASTTTASSSGTSGSGSGSTSGGNPCTPTDTTLCGHGQYCEYTVMPCVDGNDDFASPGTCATLCSQAPTGAPACGGPCSSDIDCDLQENCYQGTCQGFVCPAQPIDCSPECQVMSVPHSCGACVCEVCPIFYPDAGSCPLQNECGTECCSGDEYCCLGGNGMPVCVVQGSDCPIDFDAGGFLPDGGRCPAPDICGDLCCAPEWTCCQSSSGFGPDCVEPGMACPL